MRWLLFRRGKPNPAAPSDESVTAQAEASRALRDAKAMTCRAEDLACKASEVAANARAIRERNHVAEALIAAIRGV